MLNNFLHWKDLLQTYLSANYSLFIKWKSHESYEHNTYTGFIKRCVAQERLYRQASFSILKSRCLYFIKKTYSINQTQPHKPLPLFKNIFYLPKHYESSDYECMFVLLKTCSPWCFICLGLSITILMLQKVQLVSSHRHEKIWLRFSTWELQQRWAQVSDPVFATGQMIQHSPSQQLNPVSSGRMKIFHNGLKWCVLWVAVYSDTSMSDRRGWRWVTQYVKSV